jgi:hypothetical protein
MSVRTYKLNQGKKLDNQIHQLAYQKYGGIAPSGMMGRRRRDGNHTSQKNNSIQDLVGNEENGYPIPDINKTNDKCN